MTKITLIISSILILFTLAATGCGLLSESPAPSSELEAAPVEVEEAAASDGTAVYTIEPLTSKVRFELDELLRGQPKTVVGVSDQVSGEISADLNDLSTAAVGTIQINARTLATDNNFRNRALRNEILNTGDFEFITFTPTAVNGLSGSAAAGDTVEFTLSGDLTIRDTTQPVTFNVTATAVSDAQLEGTASAVVQRADYNLTIPSVPSVADVEEEVELYIDFVAKAS